MSKKISNKDLIKNLQDLYKQLGHAPKKNDLRVICGSKYCASAYVRAFGSLGRALLAANIKPHQIRGLKNNEVLDDIRKIFHKLGKVPTHDEYSEAGGIYNGFSPIKKRFGSWTKALMMAGIPVVNLGKADKQFILEELKKWYIKNNCDVNCLSYWTLRKAKKAGKFIMSCNTIKNHFPDLSWENIMKQIDPLYETKDPFIKRQLHIGLDKNKYLSLLELQVGNYLFKLKKMNKLKNYYYEMLVCKERSWTCDFLIITNDNKEIWLEVDGMRNNRKAPYTKKNEKIQYYKDNNINYKILSYNKNTIKFLDLILKTSYEYKIANKMFDLSEINDEFVFFNKKEIYEYHINNGSESVFSDLVEPFYEFLLQYININGWIYPPKPNYNINDLKIKDGVLNSSSRVGGQFIKSHFKSFWEASNNGDLNPISVIYNKKLMLYLLKYRFGINNSKKYKYNFGNGDVFFNELFNISLKQVRRSLETNRCTVSFFKPLIAKYIYNKYGFNGMNVWDPCAGFGGRFLGFLGTFESGMYIGNEPNLKTFNELNDLSERIDVKNRINLSSEPIESASIPSVDLVFTCPPYDFKEHYCNDNSQSDMKYKTYTEWVNGFLVSLLKKSYESLSNNKKCIIVINYKNSDTCVNVAERVGFVLKDSIDINNSKTHFNPTPNSEKCLIFQK
jgi:hypothetical protein